MKYLSVKEYADKIGITRQAVHYRIKVGLLKAEKIGGRWLILIEAKD